jgi:hypothetical protein
MCEKNKDHHNQYIKKLHVLEKLWEKVERGMK